MIHLAYIVLIMAIMSFAVWYTDTIKEAGQDQCKATYETQLRADLNLQIQINDDIEAENNQLVLDLLNKQPEIRTVYKTIEKKVNVYVKQNAACNLTRGAVQLRNTAGDPEQLQPGYHRQLSETEAGEASTISQRTAERQTHLWGKQYNELSDRYQTLLNVCENNNKAVE